MQRVVIFGNSGAGKSTLAEKLARDRRLVHLDLDSFAWERASPTTRRAIEESAADIAKFVDQTPSWVIEGCYSDLLALVIPDCSEMIFLNPGVDACIANCRSRPWEPHKYANKEAQDANLEMLIEWVRAYETRDDEFSLASHRRLFDTFDGMKSERDR